jgi:hypothetical protein
VIPQPPDVEREVSLNRIITRGLPLPITPPKEATKRKIIEMLLVDLIKEPGQSLLGQNIRHERPILGFDNDKMVGSARPILW